MASMSAIRLLLLIPALAYFSPIPLSISSASPVLLYSVTFILGCSFPILLSQAGSRIASWLDGPRTTQKNVNQLNDIKASNNDKDGLYGLDHAILNAPAPVAETMWMNMGYWRNATHLPQACEALVEKVLQNAGLGETGGPKGSRKKRVLLDLGFGCGQQTLYLMNRDEESQLFDRYIGITIDKTQYDFARSRVDAVKARKQTTTTTNTEIFCADAADPGSWPRDLENVMSSTFQTDGTERYVLALDTLYHFRPSRRNIFKYAHSTLHANFFAFDIFRAPPPAKSTLKSTFNSLFLRILTPGLAAPFSNFVTPEAYKAQLQDAGYEEQDISIEDITSDVFPGLATFLETRQRELAALGLGGFSKWRVSGWLFRWLAGGDVLRAGVIFAKWRRN